MKPYLIDITHHKLVVLAKTLSFITCITLLIPVVSQAQFIVKKNTLFTTTASLTSLEAANIFESSLLGPGTLHLKGESQSLYTHNHTSLQGLHIENASEIDIKTVLHIKDDLTIKSGLLKLKHPIYLQGDLYVLNLALIDNYRLIKFLNTHILPNKNIGGTITHYSNMVCVSKRAHLSHLLPDCFNEKSIIAHSDLLYKPHHKIPLRPPPEFI